MARIVIHTEKTPKEVSIGGEINRMCMCGLSKNRPFCDESHVQTQDEKKGVYYIYGESGRQEVGCEEKDDYGEKSGCGDGCCCGS